MTRYLIFQLYGPIASWGDIAVGELRPGLTHPSKSAIVGMLAAAAGVRRDDERQSKMTRSYGCAVCSQNLGTPLIDFHTAQVPSSGSGRNRVSFATRKDELSTPKQNTILSRRDYRVDSYSQVVIWIKEESAPFTLEELHGHLKFPVFAPYLGRKSCPLALPMQPQIISASTITEALGLARFHKLEQFSLEFKEPVLFWEEGAISGLPAQSVYLRRDVSLSRKLWLFDNRKEYQAHLKKE